MGFSEPSSIRLCLNVSYDHKFRHIIWSCYPFIYFISLGISTDKQLVRYLLITQ
ncbi:hypothetical protein CLV81_3387 [Flagellimonas meridianipacifica]|uniref:Uncharacterized protein n=1 Tax=Flagellimonas meridianipacifica TaxID=1080225 RepID=A0A2T0MBW3_9FLAO|nr:hypothetical protein CLV81_3387 [Allomuricauda pacifica]